MKKTCSRRSFLHRVTAAGLVAPACPRLLSGASDDQRLRHAAVGVGGMGLSDLRSIISSRRVNVVALCDVDGNALNEAAKALPEARVYKDWRELLSKEAENIDSVNVSTPDHMHAPIAMSAMRLGKHVYCQKPLTHELYEARRLTETAREQGVVTQMGIQIHAHQVYRRAVKMIQEGAIGKVTEWHSWSAAKYSKPGMGRPEGEDPVPASLDWDLWIGVAPFRPYKAEVYHPNKWRAWQDFGTGGMGDFACHILDPVFTALGLKAPLRVSAEAPPMNDEVWNHWGIVHYEFPGTAMTAGDTIKGTWYDGGKKPPDGLAPLSEGQALPGSGSLIIGEEGMMVLPHYKEPWLLPNDKFKEYTPPEVKPLNHYHQWVAACLGEGQAEANFDYSGPLTETVLLGTIAVRFPGKTLEWDAPGLRVENLPEANAFLRRSYRTDWTMPGLTG